MNKINIGINEVDAKEIAIGLSRALADTYVLYLQTQNFHWNIESNLFAVLHPMLGEQYSELAAANDTLAERIRMLGHYAPATFLEFQELASLKETIGPLDSAKMLECLYDNHEKIIKTLRIVANVATKASDEGTINIIADRIMSHEKTAWMLRSSVIK